MEKLKFDHIGVATKNIEKELIIFSDLGYEKKSDIFIDENQGIRGVFIEAKNQPRLELLENLHENGPLTNILSKGIKFYHYAYSTHEIINDMEYLINEKQAIVVSPIKDASYYKKVVFLMLPNKMLVELVEYKEEFKNV